MASNAALREPPAPQAAPESMTEPSAAQVPSRFGGAVGAGVVLVLLPSGALIFGIRWLDDRPGTGLPIVALFGIMVLVGTLAMTATLFKRLGLSRRNEPLALPPGSVRATIALALIVLFSIIAAAVLHPAHEVIEIKGLTAEAKAELQRDARVQVLGTVSESCAISAPAASAAEAAKALATADWKPSVVPCAAGDQRFTATVSRAPDASTQELAKQLLQMIGGLMATTVGFYFAARTATDKAKEDSVVKPVDPPNPVDPPKPLPAVVVPSPPLPPSSDDGHDEHVDGCNVIVEHPSADHELPIAKGGVVPK